MNKSVPSIYHYIITLIRMYPFTHQAIQYISRWPEECKKKYKDASILKMAIKARADEKGHDELILKDLKELKIPIEIALTAFRSDLVTKKIEEFNSSVEEEPLNFLAWLYYAESKAINLVTKEVIEGYKTTLGPFNKAIRFWRIHSAIGPEVQHVARRKEWINSLPPHQSEMVKKEVHKIGALALPHKEVIDFVSFERFLESYAPHIIELAYRERVKLIECFPFDE